MPTQLSLEEARTVRVALDRWSWWAWVSFWAHQRPSHSTRRTRTLGARRNDKKEREARMLSEEALLTLMKEYDDPENIERPRNFDPQLAAHRFEQIRTSLEELFGPSCESGLYQDASIYGEIEIPSETTGFSRHLWVQLSNFGHFVTAGTGVWVKPGPTEGLTAEVESLLGEICTEAGCFYVPLELLLQPYDGKSLLGDLEVPEACASSEPSDAEGDRYLPICWADRYFSWV